MTKPEIEKARQLVETVLMRLSREENSLDRDIQIELEKDPTIASGLLHILIESYSRKGIAKKQSARYKMIMVLLEEALTQMRYGAERGRQWAIDAAEGIQQEIAEKVFNLEVDAHLPADLAQAISCSGLQPHPAIKAGQEKISGHYARFTAPKDLSDLDRLFDAVAASGSNNPVELYKQIISNLNLLPQERQLAAIMLMARANNPAIREISSFMLLHPQREIRIQVPALFGDEFAPMAIDPVVLRRLIGLRNWLPEEERPELDRIIGKAQTKQVKCAPMPQLDIVGVYATVFDGSGMQGVLFESRGKRIFHIGHVLVRQRQGIRDAWGEKNLSNREMKAAQRDFLQSGLLAPVEPAYLEKLLPHFIWLGLQLNSAPPPELLQTAETAGTYWQPKQLDFDEEIEHLVDAAKPLISDPDYLQLVMRQSGGWPELDFGASWFEDDVRVDNILKRTRFPFGSRQMIDEAKAAILEEILSEKRTDWSERLLWMALLTRARQGGNQLPWEPFCVLARELRYGGPLSAISLMVAVAERSVYSGLRRMEELPR